MMTLAAGTKLGRYEIRSKIGEGGMGEVYRARDTKLNRDVAIKVLPAALSQDEDRLRRFEQEAQAASALNHPNILAVYDVGTHDGAPYVVSELLEGESMKERLDDDPIAQRKAVDYAVQVTHGLTAAHEKGIVHRDLKPDNLFITNDDRVKILDFGIAKLIEPVGEGIAQTDIATRKVHTDPGTVMGTVGYMSPEQVRGRHVDHRSDIFSFGAVLYEMLSGQRAFRGESAVETLNSILKDEPTELTATSRNVAPALERVVWHCLEKSPERRFQSARDLAFALEALSGSSSVSGQTISATAALPARSKIVKQLPWIVTVALLIILLAVLPFALAYFRRAPAEASVVRFAVPLPEKATVLVNFDMHNLSISPDGKRLAFAANYEGERKLWVRPLGALEAQALPGTEGAYSPFWSPDSRYIAFFAGSKLRRIDSSGTSSQTICDLTGEVETAGTWGRDGVILYLDRASNEQGRAIHRVAATGGTPFPVTKVEQWAPWPWVHFLSDGRHYLLYEWNGQDPAARGIYVASLDSTESKLLLPTAPTRVEYAQGYLIFAREGSLLAQPFDEKNLRISGEPFTVVERLPYFDQTGWTEFSVSENGVLAYLSKRPPARLVWLDRGGRETGQVGAPGWYGDLRLSPDAQKLALTLSDERTISGDIWIQDVGRGTPTRFAFGPTDEGNAVWSPDARRLAYFTCCEGQSPPANTSTLRIKDVSETGKGQAPLEPGFHTPLDWSPDGRFVLFSQQNGPTTKYDLWVLPVSGDAKPFPFLQTPFSEEEARFSPDGHWVAFVSNETGRAEVYVTRFDQPGEKLRISNGGGRSPCWRRDGKELFFLAADNSLMSVAVKAGQTFEFGTPAILFRNDSIMYSVFDVTADGQRFIVSSSAGQTQTAPFTVVMNWTADLKK